MAKSLELKTNVNAESLSSEQLITGHIDIWTSAIEQKSSAGRGTSNKFSLYGIKKLRELILELAVRGKLVPQDPNDEAASVLLERIAAEKAQLVKEGKLKKQKPLPEIDEDEKPFELPERWEWSKLGSLSSDIHYGYTASAMHNSEGLRLLRITDIQNDKVNWSTVPACDISLEKAKNYLLENDDILLARTGGTIGKSYLVENINVEAIFASYLIRVRRIESMYASYIKVYLGSQLYWRQLYDNAAGTGQPNVNATALKSLLFPIPPKEEQHRIVAKVDELMLLCDALEAQTEASISAHQTLVETLLNALLLPNTTPQAPTNASNTLADSLEPAFDNSDANSPEPSLANSFEKAWLRIAEHFDTLFTTAASIDTLKQTILQLAVMGKLVPQNVNDEPAAKLLERIAAEKSQLIADKKIKKQKPLVDFEGLGEMKKPLPNSWEWIRLADTADLVRGGSPRPAGDPRFYGGDIPFLKVGDITRKSSKFVEGFNSTITEAGLHKTRLIETRTVLLSNSGATLGIPAICTFPATFNDGVAAFVERSQFIFDEYLYLYLSTLSKWFLDIASRGQGQPNLNTDIIKATWFALPPHEEQHRIVAKADELMVLCDQLKARLSDAQTNKLHLTDAIVEQAI
ncbi:restriction endonuclease subunit S [Shewanella sp. OMA3-2]|uniref:restriction endonuclease subunit S n=1 Tax=Shewanella sp. OMA3-2 TaxID=2908650 RepID=UPI001F2D87C5|nr:restriction endonuclease subunit S [Shewanella sp. OMA3-2]UJF20711.1 restriction endonuclease subunit S [Shewanella sp. OMA3-2]